MDPSNMEEKNDWSLHPALKAAGLEVPDGRQFPPKVGFLPPVNPSGFSVAGGKLLKSGEMDAELKKQLWLVLAKLDILNEKFDKSLGGAVVSDVSTTHTHLGFSNGGTDESTACSEDAAPIMNGAPKGYSILTGAVPKQNAALSRGFDLPVVVMADAMPSGTGDKLVAALASLDGKLSGLKSRDSLAEKELRKRQLERKESRDGLPSQGQGERGSTPHTSGEWSRVKPPEQESRSSALEVRNTIGEHMPVELPVQLQSGGASVSDPKARTSTASGSSGSQKDVQRPKLRTQGTGLSNRSHRSNGDSATKVIKRMQTSSMDQVRSVVAGQIRERSEFSVSVWEFFEDPESSIKALLYATLSPVIVVMSVIITVLLNVETASMKLIPDDLGAAVEIFLEVLFLFEVGIRFAVCPNRLAFILQFNNAIDCLAFMPLFLRASQGFVLPDRTSTDIGPSILFGVVPAVRLLKVLRYFQTFRLLLKAFKLSLEALPVMLYTLAIMGLVFSSLIYFVEDRSNVETLPASMWLMIVTMTTVGYGDMVPQTTAGRMVVAGMAISSVLYMAIPIGLIGNAFNEVWSDRDRIILVQRARYCLTQWGYGAESISQLFKDHDDNGDGELNLTEFRKLMSEMRVGLADRAITKLFEVFDSDQSGFITDVEFVKAVFPAEYHELYADATDETRVSQLLGGDTDASPSSFLKKSQDFVNWQRGMWNRAFSHNTSIDEGTEPRTPDVPEAGR